MGKHVGNILPSDREPELLDYINIVTILLFLLILLFNI